MKTIKLFSLVALSLALATVATAQTKSATFKVSGNCGMCKAKIEKAAKDAGATTATWNADTKNLTVSYKSSTTNTAKIQSKIASVGYDNAGVKASAEAYNKLHSCCKYDRGITSAKAAGCSDEASCDHAATPDCCKDGKCTKPGHSGKDCCKKAD